MGGLFDDAGAKRGSAALWDAVFAMTENRLAAPCSKRRLAERADRDAAMPDGWSAPSPDQCCRALDAVADAEEHAEEHLYSRLCDLTGMDLALVCCDLASTHFEAPGQRSDRFGSRAFGCSRGRRPDRPRIVIGLLCIGGDDRHEVEVCGVDPRTRGRRAHAVAALTNRWASCCGTPRERDGR